MALDAERTQAYPLDSLASLKSGASDVRGLIARAGRRLLQTSRVAAAGTASGAATALAFVKRK